MAIFQPQKFPAPHAWARSHPLCSSGGTGGRRRMELRKPKLQPGETGVKERAQELGISFL